MGKALLVIDMLNDFVDEKGVLYVGAAGRRIIENVKQRVNAARKAGDEVIFICDRHAPDDAEFDMFPPHCLAGEKGAEIIPELEPQTGERVIPKRRYSAFFGTDLDLTLREKGVTDLELVGVCTNICVFYTAAEARMLNYKVSVSREAVASFDEEAHRFALQEMEKTLGVKLV